jgi:hypothetical protein
MVLQKYIDSIQEYFDSIELWMFAYFQVMCITTEINNLKNAINKIDFSRDPLLSKFVIVGTGKLNLFSSILEWRDGKTIPYETTQRVYVLGLPEQFKEVNLDFFIL